METELADHSRDLDNRFYGLTRKHLMRIAYEFAERFNKDKRLIGKDWVAAFCKQHQLKS